MKTQKEYDGKKIRPEIMKIAEENMKKHRKLFEELAKL